MKIKQCVENFSKAMQLDFYSLNLDQMTELEHLQALQMLMDIRKNQVLIDAQLLKIEVSKKELETYERIENQINSSKEQLENEESI